MEKEPYQIEYDAFISNYKRTEIGGEEVGELIARLAQYYSQHNLKMVMEDRKKSFVAKDIESRADSTGKPISSSKAQVFLDATDEAHNYRVSRAHVMNLETMINALKALQKGILNEYQNSSL